MDHSPEGWPALVLPKRLGQERGPEGLKSQAAGWGLGPLGAEPWGGTGRGCWEREVGR